MGDVIYRIIKFFMKGFNQGILTDIKSWGWCRFYHNGSTQRLMLYNTGRTQGCYAMLATPRGASPSVTPGLRGPHNHTGCICHPGSGL